MWELPPGPPNDEDMLRARAEALAGYTLREVAARFGWRVPVDLRRHKGWIGNLVELALGATAGSRPVPDFPELGIELKTLPVQADGSPRESTFVCTARLGGLDVPWEESWVRKKLSRVLWMPVVGGGPPGERVLGGPFLWSPGPEAEALLRADWDELTEIVGRGELDQLTGRRGKALQLRPKGATAADSSWMLDADGEWARVTDRAFYLRASFTRKLVRSVLRVDNS